MAAHIYTGLTETLEKLGRLPENEFREWIVGGGLTSNENWTSDDPHNDPFKLAGTWGHLYAYVKRFITVGELEDLLRQDLERMTYEWIGYGWPDNREEWLAAYWRRKDLLDQLDSPYRLSELQKREDELRPLAWYYAQEEWLEPNLGESEVIGWCLHMASENNEWCITLAPDQKRIKKIQVWSEHWPEEM